MTDQVPLPEKPAGGWDAVATDKLPDLSLIPANKVYCVSVQYKVKPGMAEEYARGMDATQGQFYRQQPGCIAYVFGLDSQDENMVLGTAIWSSKELFDTLPKNPNDLEKLESARGAFRAMLDESLEASLTVHESQVTFGKCANDAGFPKDLGWDDIMGNDYKPDPSQVVKSPTFMLQGTIKTQPGKAETFAKGMEATQASFYRSQPGCIEYRFGLAENETDTVIATVLWSSKEDFDNCPSNAGDLAKLNEARAPFMKMLNGPEEEAMNFRSSSQMFGNIME